MKRILLVIVSLIFFHKSDSQVMWEFKKDTVISWSYSEGDEFNDSIINLDYWKYIGSARSLFANKEQEYYTDGKNHFISNGSLKLTARKDTVVKRTIDWLNDEDSLISGKRFYGLNKRQFPYTAGKLISKKTYHKGFFECRFKLPSQKGYWPAFWMYGGSPNEEIDIMECKPEKSDKIHVDTHCGNKCDLVQLFLHKKSYGGWIKTKYNLEEGFNIAACDWDDNGIRFYLNGECIGIANVKFDVEKNLAINIAVPGKDAPFNPPPSDKDTSTAVFEIDYLRIWNKTETSAPIKTNVSTNLDTVKTLITTSMVKPKGKSVYGKKSEHNDDGVFISFFQNTTFIQVYALGNYTKERPSYKLINSSGEEKMSGEITAMISTINTINLQKGKYRFFIELQGRSAERDIVVR